MLKHRPLGSDTSDVVVCFPGAGTEPAVAVVGDRFTAGPVPGDVDEPGCHSVIVTHDDGLTAYTDPVGQFPLYWARDDGRVLVGASASVLARETCAALDQVMLAARLACPDMPDLFGTRTMYEHVHRLPEGTRLDVDAAGARQTAHHRIQADPAMRPADAAELLRDRLVASVAARLNGRVSADFSGGFDSTSLAFVAAASHEVAALTSWHEGIAAGSDDVARARRYARLGSGLTHHMVAVTDEHLPFQKLLAAEDEPDHTPFFLGPLRARLASARDLGADCHLVGEGGDVVLGAPPAYLADLARASDLATLWRHCVTWARLRARSPLALFRRAVTLAVTGRRGMLLGLARDLDRGRSAPIPTWEEEWIGYGRRPQAAWLTTRARRRLAAEIRAFADHDIGGVGDQVTRTWLRSQVLTQRAVRAAGQEFGISVQAPLLDSAVVRACLSLPARRRVEIGVQKPLLRRALASIVPAEVLSHPVKGDYTRELHHGVRLAAPVLRRLLADSAAADHGLIEPRPVRAALDNAVQGLPTPWSALNQVFAVEMWLRSANGKAVTT